MRNIGGIGDRASDIQTAININATGILIPFENEPGEEDKARKLDDQPHVQIVLNLVEAAECIILRLLKKYG